MTGSDHASPRVPALAQASKLSLSLAELTAWGEHLGQASHPPLVITLAGELGSGKTTLAQAICRGFGVTEAVTSPTFAIVHRYDAPRSPVYHLDLYRLSGPADLTNIGWDEIVSARALVLIVWPERARGALPAHVPIDIEHVDGDASRRVLLAG